MIYRIGVLSLLLTVVASQDAATIKRILESEQLIPDVIDHAPGSVIQISYGEELKVNLGNELTPAQVASAPNVNWSTEPNAKYTLVMVDPDAPSRQYPQFRSALHWLVINIPGSQVAQGETIQKYAGSGPPEGSGLHRYAFFVFKQPAGQSVTLRKADAEEYAKRRLFSLKTLVSSYNLGEPIAANFFQAQFDESLRARGGQMLEMMMKANGVIPDVIDVAPNYLAQLKWANGRQALPGLELTPTQVKDHPSNVTWPTEPNSLYTLVMVDPDAPSRQNPIRREYLHWLVVNIPCTDISRGETYTQYIGSGAPKDTGLHRYVLLVFKQPNNQPISPNRVKATDHSAEGRPKFRVKEFAKEYNLGKPVAGNFFQAQYDDYVPILHAQLMSGSTTPSPKAEPLSQVKM